MGLVGKKKYLEQYAPTGDETLYRKEMEYSYGIGRFMLSFSALEAAVEYYTLELIHGDMHEIGYQTIKYFKYKQKILFLRDQYRTLVRYSDKKVKSALFKIIDDLFKTLNDLGEFRNMVCHADWSTLDKNYFVKTKVEEDEEGIIFTKKKITCRELYNRSRKCDSLANKMDSINEEILNKTIRSH